MFAKQSGKWFPILAGAMIVAALAAQAQMPPAGGMPNSGSPAPQPGPPMTPGAVNPNAESPQMPIQNYQDQDFIKHVFENNDAQVRMSQLAQQKSSSDDVKQFGDKMVEIHNQLDQQLQPLAKKLDVNQPKKPNKKEKKELAQLQALSGPSFDSAYLQAMAAAQQQSMKLFANEVKSGEKTSAALAAKQDEPVLAQHFAVLQKIAAAHNVPLETSGKK
jgi:putative membrane protein